MKMCFVSRALPVHRLGGLEHHLGDLAGALAKRGHEVHVLTTTGGAVKGIAGELLNPRIHIIPGTAPGDYDVVFFRRVHAALQELHGRYAFDIIIPIDMAGLFVRCARFNVPVVPLIHGTMTSEVPLDRRYWCHLGALERLSALWKYKARLALLPFFWRMVRESDAIIVDSNFTRRELAGAMCSHLSRGGRHRSGGEAVSKIHVVPLGIDISRYFGAGEVNGSAAPACADGVLQIGLLGRLQRIKGLEIALRAALQLRIRGISFRMNIGGTGDFALRARQYIREHHLENFVLLAGRIAPGDLPAFFAANDVFLFPDLTQPAFGLVAVEAMAYGLPVVAARSGAIPEVVDADSGWLYEAWNVGELASTLAMLAKNPEEIQKKRIAAGMRWREFTAEKMADRTETVLREILVTGEKNGGADEARTRDLRRDRPAF